MSFPDSLWSAINAFFRRTRVDAEIDSELRSHILHRADDLEREGIPRFEAERRARIEFGAYQRFKEETHRALQGYFPGTFLDDIRFSVRLLRKAPAFSLTVVLLLGLGIGATAGVFSLVDAVLLKPLPYPDAGRIVMPWIKPPQGIDIGGFDKFPWDPTQFHAVEKETQTYRYLGAFESANFNLTGAGEPALMEGLRVSWGFFPALGVAPTIGRIFTPEEDQPGHEREALLSDRVWRERFQADPGIVGRTIDLNGMPYAVVGVMPPEFSFPHANEMPADFTFPREAQIWVPAAMPAVTPRFTPSELAIVARLQPGISVRQAQANMDIYASRMDRLFPKAKGWFNSTVTPLRQQVAGDSARSLLLMLSAVGVVLLIVCFNVASLLLTRAIDRGREFTLRAALGAGRGRILRQLLTESLLLSVAGGVAGLGLGLTGVWLVRNYGPASIPRLHDAQPDLRIFAFTLGVTLLTGVVFGLAPALGAARVDMVESLKEGGQKSGSARHQPRLRNALVVVQIAMALVLVIATGLLTRTFIQLLRVDAGFRADHVLTFELSLPSTRYPDRQRIAQFYQQALPRLRAVAGVDSAALTEAVPMGDAPEATVVRIPDHPQATGNAAPMVDYTIASPDLFATLGTPFVRGRDFLDSDTDYAPGVTVINRAMAQRYWPNEDAIGKKVVIPAHPDRPIFVIGIVANTKHSSLREAPSPEMFVPYTQDAWPSMAIMQIVLRSRAAPGAVMAGSRDALHSIDPGLPVAKVTTLSAMTGSVLSQERFSMVLLSFFGAFSLLLAAVGIYGVISYSVGRQTREIGIRMALGAPREVVFRAVLGYGLRLAGLGIGCGIVAALAVGQALTSFLYGVKSYDPLTFAAVPLVLALVAALAGLLPARRAASIDPMQALKTE
jgi:putative ABC transport system permease protein